MSEHELKELFGEEAVIMIIRSLNKLVTSLSKELEAPDIDILLGLWSSANLCLKKINKDHPDLEIQSFMNEVTILHNKALKEFKDE